MEETRGIQVWPTANETMARVWVCGHCGMKIYYGRLVVKPEHHCLCRKYCWRRREEARGWSDRLFDNTCYLNKVSDRDR